MTPCHGLETGLQKRAYATLVIDLACAKPIYLLSGTGESEASEAKA